MESNRKIVIYVLVMTVIISAGALISIGVANEKSDFVPNKLIYLTLEDNGSTVSLNVGDTVNLTLKDYGDGGYIWKITKLDEQVLNITERLDNWGSSGVPGDWGYDTWIFTADDTGTTTLELACSQLWEEEIRT